MYTYLLPVEDIGVPCQLEEFNPDLLRERLQSHTDPMDHSKQDLKKIPLIRKTAAVADIMDMTEIEEKLGQYCQLWKLYGDASCELARKSKLSQEEATRVCKVYEPYIHDILQQVDVAVTLFVMEKELRHLKGRGYFPIPTIRPQSTRIENTQQARKILESVDEELVQVLTTVRESEKDYEKEKEKARIREQARTPRQPPRQEYNFLSLNSSTKIKNTDATTGNQNHQVERGISFNPNTIQHLYTMTEATSHSGQYEPPANDSII